MATDDDDDDDDDVEDVKGGRAEGGMRRGVGIDGKGWRCGGDENALTTTTFCFFHPRTHCATCA